MPVISGITAGSIAEEGGVAPGDELVAINGERIKDVFDYMYHTGERELELLIRGIDGEEWILDVEKPESEDIGLVFGSALMDEPRSCANKCVFCFIDQLPEGMRAPLYFKDDDARLTFLNGNYVTLTNTSRAEIERIVRYRLSPVNISVHATDAALRAKMLGAAAKTAAASGTGADIALDKYDILPKMRYLTESGISVNAQIVLCKGYNDGGALDHTLSELGALNDHMASVSVVPSGLTGHRRDLPKLEPFGRDDAEAVLRQVSRWQKRFRRERGGRLVFAADEFYTLAGRSVPGAAAYDGFPQLENGVGMLALFKKQFDDGLRRIKRQLAARYGSGNAPGRTPRPLYIFTGETPRPLYIFTGVASAPMLGQCVKKFINTVETLASDYPASAPGISISVIIAENAFFGGYITVTGLLTGSDIIKRAQSINFPKNARILISKTMLKYGADIFLDDITLEMLRNELGTDIIAVENDGGALASEFLRALHGG